MLAGAIEDFQHIVLAEFGAEVEAATVLVSAAVALEAHSKAHRQEEQHCCCYEHLLKNDASGNCRQGGYDSDVSHQVSYLVNGALISQRLSAFVLLRILQRQRMPHSQLYMLSEGVDENGCHYKCADWIDHGLHNHSRHHYQHSDLVHLLGRETVEYRKHQYQKEAWKFPEELRHSPVHLPHPDNLCKIVVNHAFI